MSQVTNCLSFHLTTPQMKCQVAPMCLPCLCLTPLQSIHWRQCKHADTPASQLRRKSRTASTMRGSWASWRAGRCRQTVKWTGAAGGRDESWGRNEIGGRGKKGEEEEICDPALNEHSWVIHAISKWNFKNITRLSSFFVPLCFLWERKYANLGPMHCGGATVVL